MAAVVPPADQTAEFLQKLSLDAQPKPLEIPEPTKKPTAKPYGSVDSGNAPNGHVPPYERSLTPLLHEFTDPTLCFVPNAYPYYYGGYDGTGSDWGDYSRYEMAEGVDLNSGFYGDNGSLMYPGYGFAPYGNDQLYGTQHYHYPSHYFQPNAPNLSAPKTDVSTSGPADHKLLPVETLNGPKSGATKGNSCAGPLKPTHQNSVYNTNSAFGMASLPGSIGSGYQDGRFGGSPFQWSDGPAFGDVQPGRVTNTGIANSIPSGKNVPSLRNQSYRPNSHVMGLHHPVSGMGSVNGFGNRFYPNKLYGPYGSTPRSGYGWSGMDNKYRNNRVNGSGFYGYANDNLDGFNELSKGPRGKGSKNQKSFSPVTLAVNGQDLSNGANEEEKIKENRTPDCEQYNKVDFPQDYVDAKFFVIKSYSEDDVHKSVKYNVWASTPNGNKKLDAAYREAQEKDGDCPIFLFFSVNTSGQFVGVAEMTGSVDFEKSVQYWQQDKWNGCFALKWHIVKDVPNSLLKHIILENNEGKPVTNSRDTQEVMLEQGLKMLKIFKDHSSKTCLLDDFDFYENRQKGIQEKKAKQQQYQKQIWEGKPTTEKKENADLTNGDLNLHEDLKITKAVNADNVLVISVANAC